MTGGYIGTPQGGGIIRPNQQLANIYLDKLDKYIAEYTKLFDKGDARRINPAYARIQWTVGNMVARKLKVEQDGSIRNQLLAKIKELKKGNAFSYPIQKLWIAVIGD